MLRFLRLSADAGVTEREVNGGKAGSRLRRHRIPVLARILLEAGGTGLDTGLDAEGRRIDASTLPSTYTDGSVVTTQDGRAQFKFGLLRQSGMDAVLADGQVLDVVDGNYGSLDLALLAAPGALGYPFGEFERYKDGSKEPLRLGPVPASDQVHGCLYDHRLPVSGTDLETELSRSCPEEIAALRK